MSDNYHQPVMGGTAVQHMMLGTGDVMSWETSGRYPAAGNQRRRSDPKASTRCGFPPATRPGPTARRHAAWYSSDRELSQDPTLASLAQLRLRPFLHDQQSEPGLPAERPDRYGQHPRVASAAVEHCAPSATRSTRNKISWAYYGGGYNAAVRFDNGSTDPVDELIGTGGNLLRHLQLVPVRDVDHGRSGAAQGAHQGRDRLLQRTRSAAICRPSPTSSRTASSTATPASSKLDLLEALIENILDELKAQPDLFKDTAFVVTFDEGGGYWDSGFIPADRLLRRRPAHPDHRRLALLARRQGRAQLQRPRVRR